MPVLQAIFGAAARLYGSFGKAVMWRGVARDYTAHLGGKRQFWDSPDNQHNMD